MPDESRRASPRELFVVVRDERVRLVTAGPGQAPVVLLLHGWGATTYNFRRVIPGLALAGFRTIAPDLRGHGASDKPLDHQAYSSGAMAEWVAALLDHLPVKPVVVVGQSIGGAITLDLARARPDLVRGAVLVAPVGFTRMGRVDLLRRMAVWRWGRVRVRRWIVRLVMRRIYGVRRQWTDEDVEAYLAPLRDERAVAALLSLVRAFDFAPRHPADAAHLAGRLWMLFGEHDRPVPYHEAVPRARRFAGANVEVLAGVGHVPAEEAPDDVIGATLTVARAVLGNEAPPALPGERR